MPGKFAEWAKNVKYIYLNTHAASDKVCKETY